MADFPRLRTDVRANEASTDKLMAQYSEFVSDPPASSQELEEQIEQLLETRQPQVQQLVELAYAGGATPLMRRQAERHQEILGDHRATLRRLRSAISQERSRRSLLSSVRQDIRSHRESQAATTNSTLADEADSAAYYTGEMRRVDHSRSLADTLLTSAYEARSELERQQRVLGDVQRRMLGVLARVPGVNSLISKINTRQKRNSLVLASLIVFGVLFIVFVR